MFCKLMLTELYLCYNLIDTITPELCSMKTLSKLGLKCNSFSEIHFDFINILKNLTHFELDWFRY
jgi:Leucine-rich repeat (LRR) protein